MLTTILATIVVLGVLIFVHELGHFVTAKMVDIEVPRFSIGFGPKVVGFRRGETEYVISALPLGGYVKMAGMEEMERIEGGVGADPKSQAPTTVEGADLPDPAAVAVRERGPRDFESKSLPARALVISAGVIMNLLFALFAYIAIAWIWGVPTDPGTRLGGVSEELLTAEAAALAELPTGLNITAINGEPVGTWEEIQHAFIRAGVRDVTIAFEDAQSVTIGLPERDEERGRVLGALEPAVDVEPVLVGVLKDGPADQAGLKPGDRIVRAGGRDVSTWQEFVAVVERSPGAPVPLVVQRDAETLDITLTPKVVELESGITVGRIDVPVPVDRIIEAFPQVRPNLLGAISAGARDTWANAALTVDFLGGLFTGRQSARSLGGPIMIGQISGRMARLGMEAFISFMALLSINLAILNLLPIPVLDGGHLVFLGIEAVRGRALSIESRMRLTQVGFVLIMLLMAWAIGNDLLRTIGI